MCRCCFFKTRNSSKELSTSITCVLRFGPISVKKEFNISATSAWFSDFCPLYSISFITVLFDDREVSSLIAPCFALISRAKPACRDWKGGGGPDPTFPLLSRESRIPHFFLSIPHPVFSFPKIHLKKD